MSIKLPSMNQWGSFILHWRTLLCMSILALAVGDPLASAILSATALAIMVYGWLKQKSS